MLLQVLSGEGERGDLSVIEGNTGKIVIIAQKERSLEYVCGFEVGHGITSFAACSSPLEWKGERGEAVLLIRKKKLQV
jgi:hypothetical protein